MYQRTDTDSDCFIYHDNIKLLHITTCIQFLEHFLLLISIKGDSVKLGLVTSVFEIAVERVIHKPKENIAFVLSHFPC